MLCASDVLAIEALVSYDIDFPEEDDGPVPPERGPPPSRRPRRRSTPPGTAADEGERLRDGALWVIAGLPNAGKSSLFNALLGHDRAIVTEMPGTTRDAIEVPAVFGGFPFRLVDTAGLRASEDRIERLGVEVSRRFLTAADVVLYCVEAGQPLAPTEEVFLSSLSVPTLVVHTKGDQGVRGLEATDDLVGATDDFVGATDDLVVSAHTGRGIAAVRERLAALAFHGLRVAGNGAPVLTRERHRAALAHARHELEEFQRSRGSGLEAAIAATHLRAAVTALEGIIGLITPADVLARVFASFCVGK